MSLPNIRRVITAYDEKGQSVIAQDTVVKKESPPIAADITKFSPIWGTLHSPATYELVDGRDGAADLFKLVNPEGSTLRIIDTPPGHSSPVHRTISLDYIIMLNGEITLELENGVDTIIKAGDIVVQQGTLHRWVNHTTDTVARFASVMLGAKPVNVPDAMLSGPVYD